MVTEEVPGRPDLTFSGPAPRVVACIVDAILLFILALIVLVVASVVSSTPDMANASSLIATSVALSLPYTVYFWTGGRRATPAQRLFRIEVGGGIEGRSLTAGQAATRWLALGWFVGVLALIPALVGPVVLAVAGWSVVLLVTVYLSPIRQGFHDRFAGTAVVRPRDASNRLVVGCLIIFVAGPPLVVVWVVDQITKMGY